MVMMQLTMISVGLDDGVIKIQRSFHAHGHALLSVCQVQEATCQLLLVQLICCELHTPHEKHRLVHLEELVPLFPGPIEDFM